MNPLDILGVILTLILIGVYIFARLKLRKLRKDQGEDFD